MRVQISANTLQLRISHGWSVEDALTIPARVGSNGTLRKKAATHDRHVPVR